MNGLAVVSGVLVALSVTAGLRVTGLEARRWVYPLLLASFPLYYLLFAGVALDVGAGAWELAAGLPFAFVAFMAVRLGGGAGLRLLALGYVAHAGYDTVHESLFHNAGSPSWWPGFCGAVDLPMGLYVFFLARTAKEG